MVLSRWPVVQSVAVEIVLIRWPVAGGPVGDCGIELEWVVCGTLLCDSSSDDG